VVWAATQPRTTSIDVIQVNPEAVRGMRFRDKVAIVTGAGQGIGEVYAKALAAEGACVVVADVNEAQGARVAERDREGRARFVRVDVASPESTQAMAGRRVGAFGGIDLLVNNAAIYHGMQLAPLIAVDGSTTSASWT
jgi:NAD(P)-dependent dehydrogenase (short-subunit alcohol dehydrogenase family)